MLVRPSPEFPCLHDSSRPCPRVSQSRWSRVPAFGWRGRTRWRPFASGRVPSPVPGRALQVGADAEAFAASALDVLAVLAACASLGPFQQRLRGLVEAHRLPERLGSSRLSVVEASSDGVAPRLAHIRPVERMQGRPPVFGNRAQVRGHHLVPRRRHLDRLQQEVPIILSARRPRVRVFLVKSVFRVSSLIFFGFRHEECRPVVCFTGCPSCRT